VESGAIIDLRGQAIEDGSFWTNLLLVSGNRITEIITSCTVNIGPGSRFGFGDEMFVLEAFSLGSDISMCPAALADVGDCLEPDGVVDDGPSYGTPSSGTTTTPTTSPTDRTTDPDSSTAGDTAPSTGDGTTPDSNNSSDDLSDDSTDGGSSGNSATLAVGLSVGLLGFSALGFYAHRRMSKRRITTKIGEEEDHDDIPLSAVASSENVQVYEDMPQLEIEEVEMLGDDAESEAWGDDV
jgi:hypothetical protein